MAKQKPQHEVTVVLPLPPTPLSPNARVHWAQKARATKLYRRDARMLTIAAGGRNLRWRRAVARATFYWPCLRRRDVGNAEAMLKPVFDGMVDAGLLVDDNAGVLTHAATQFKVDPRDPRVEILVFPVTGKRGFR